MSGCDPAEWERFLNGGRRARVLRTTRRLCGVLTVAPVVAFAVVAFVVGTSSFSFAQSEGEQPSEQPEAAQQDAAQQDAAQQNAAAHFSAGVIAMREGEFDAALRRFRQAQALHAHGANLFNIAVCLEELGRLLEAQRTYRVALETDQLGPERTREGALRVESIDARLAMIEVVPADGSSQSPGAPQSPGTSQSPDVVTIDGEPCSLPCRVRVDPGTHLVRAPSFEREVTVPEGGEVRVTVPLSTPAVTDERAREQADGLGARNEVRAPSRAGWWITGGALTVLGVAGAVGFGLRTQGLKDDFSETPTRVLQEDGVRARRLTNASIATAGLGVGLMVVGLILNLTDGDSGGNDGVGVAVDARGVRLQF